MPVLTGHVFRDPALLRQALTHRSAGSPHNERLEFLGDALVNQFVAEALYMHWPKADEGALTRARAELVRESALAGIARELRLGERLVLGPGELKTGGHRRDSILADALEAVVAAIHLDAGFEACRAAVLPWFEPLIAALPPPAQRMAGRSGRLRLLVLGGSLGARALNLAVPQALAQLTPAQRPEVVHQCGTRGLDEARAAYAKAGVDALELSTDDDLVDALLRFAELRRWRSRAAGGRRLPGHLVEQVQDRLGQVVGVDRAAGHADDRQSGLGLPLPAQVVRHAHGAGRVARHRVDAAVGGAGAAGDHGQRFRREAVDPRVRGDGLAAVGISAHGGPVAARAVVQRLVGHGTFQHEHEGVEFPRRRIEPILHEIIADLIGQHRIVQVHLGKPRDGAQNDIFNTGLHGGGHRDRIAVAPRARRHPDDVYLFHGRRTSRHHRCLVHKSYLPSFGKGLGKK